jgi:hypothetical protein
MANSYAISETSSFIPNPFIISSVLISITQPIEAVHIATPNACILIECKIIIYLLIKCFIIYYFVEEFTNIFIVLSTIRLGYLCE